MIGNSHLVCFNCRRTKKKPENQTISQACAECGSPMYNLGKSFTAPRRQDNAGWLKIELMVANGWDGTNWPVSPNMSLREVKESLRAWDEQRAGLYREAQIQMGIERRQKLARKRSRTSRVTQKRQRIEEGKQRDYQEQVLEQIARQNQIKADASS